MKQNNGMNGINAVESSNYFFCPSCDKVVAIKEKALTGRNCLRCHYRNNRLRNNLLNSVNSPKNEPKTKITITQVTTDIHNVVKQLGTRPTQTDYAKAGKYSLDIVYRLFNQEWDEILASLGYKMPKKNYSYSEIVSEIERVAKELSKLPTLAEYNQLGRIDLIIIKQVIKLTDATTTTWEAILSTTLRIPIELVEQVINLDHVYYQEQLNKIKVIASKLKQTLTREQAIKFGVNVDLLIKRFNKNWLQLLELAGIDTNIDTTLTQVNPTKHCVTNEQMLADLNTIANLLGYYPSELKYDLLGSYSASQLTYRFDKTWVGVINLASSRNLNLSDKSFVIKEKTCLNKTIIEFFDIEGDREKGIDLETYKF
ncbi:MAG: hypothetical protein WAQ98_33515 [Blastocatellia bacterium]